MEMYSYLYLWWICAIIQPVIELKAIRNKCLCTIAATEWLWLLILADE